MNIQISEKNGVALAEIVSGEVVLKDAQDALDLMAECRYRGSDRLILREANLSTAFFDLKTGIAGEILQKFSNYRCRLAIIGDFEISGSKSLRDFIRESNRSGSIHFVATLPEAEERQAR